MPFTKLKHYLSDELDFKAFAESHFSHDGISIIEESMVQPMKRMHELFSSGLVKGSKLLESSVGGMVYPLFPASNCFDEIYVLEFTDASVKHFKHWLDEGDEATDWSIPAKLLCRLEGNEDGWKEKEKQVKRAIKGVYKYDLFNNDCKNSLAIPEVDCVLTVCLLNVICQTKEDFKHNLKILTSWLKPGGHLVFFLALNMSCFRVGDHKFSTLTADEKFVRQSVADTGLVIVKEEIIPTSQKNDLVDYKDWIYLVAVKESNV